MDSLLALSGVNDTGISPIMQRLLQYKKEISENANRDVLFLVVLLRVAIGLCFSISVDFWFENGVNPDVQHITGIGVSSKISNAA